MKDNYKTLYNDDVMVLIELQNHDEEKYPQYGKFCFGVIQDLDSFYGFPVGQSCLKKDECIKRLKEFIKIDQKYKKYLGKIADTSIYRWQKMIEIMKYQKD